MIPLIDPGNAWVLWALIVAGVAICICLEQNYRWAAKVSGPVLALVLAMILSNTGVMPVDAPAYGVVGDYFVPLAIPLLLFRANLRRILRETGRMFLAFHVAAFGTLVGAFLAAFIFRGAFERVPEMTGIMTGSYTGGSVNFMAVKDSYELASELTNPLIVADNFIMAGMFAVLLLISGSRFFLRRFPHPHTTAAGGKDAAPITASHWRRKEISLRDIALSLAVALILTAVSMQLSDWVKARVDSTWIVSLIGNVYVLMTFFTVGLVSVAHRWTERIHGAEELGAFMLYLFFFVIGVQADLLAVLKNVPVLFVFCLVIAVVNLVVTLIVGRWLNLDLEDLLMSVNATLGGPPSAVAMAVAKGWPGLILPGLLVGIWGYIIGTFLGVMTAETLRKLL